jgi:hypothetical protein
MDYFKKGAKVQRNKGAKFLKLFVVAFFCHDASLKERTDEVIPQIYTNFIE